MYGARVAMNEYCAITQYQIGVVKTNEIYQRSLANQNVSRSKKTEKNTQN